MKKLNKYFVEGAISTDFISQSIANHQVKTTIGGHALFLGQVRADVITNQTVQAIDFSYYETMAILKMDAIKEELFLKYPLICAHIYHSIGTVHKGEICLFVFTSAQHRKPAIEACNELVERIKKEVPIWGKEIIDDTKQIYQWKENNL